MFHTENINTKRKLQKIISNNNLNTSETLSRLKRVRAEDKFSKEEYQKWLRKGVLVEELEGASPIFKNKKDTITDNQRETFKQISLFHLRVERHTIKENKKEIALQLKFETEIDCKEIIYARNLKNSII
jgi:hypothetical protein